MKRQASVFEAAVEQDPRLRALRDLESTHCACGRRKREQQSFCKPCYKLLPGDIKNGLWTHIANGYIEWYEKAKQFLQQNGRIAA
ncbi:MAG TPA: hypothetical protein VN577_20145 [Terriglobales bacterium]|nr:hypothetical protein [Clostridia bacterium]HWR17152.1 hypothetical protein [Terriglobales bacterium]